MTDKNEIEKRKLEEIDESAESIVKSLEDIHREMTLDFSKLSSETTIEEVQKEAQQIEEDNLSAESPLDKYVRKHRQEVEELRAGFGKGLDELVMKERESLEEAMLESQEETSEEGADFLNKEKLLESELVSVEEEAVNGDFVDASLFPSPTLKELDASLPPSPKRFDAVMTEDDGDSNAEFSELKTEVATAMSRSNKNSNSIKAQPIEFAREIKEVEKEIEEEREQNRANQDLRKKIVIWLILLAVILTLFGILIYSNYNKKSGPSSSSNQPSSSLIESSSEISGFTTLYNSFFTDDSHTALKNSNFDKLKDLEEELKKVPKTHSSFVQLQENYNNLSDDISSIKAINDIFDKPVIVDGKLDEKVVLKENAEIPTVSSRNSTLDALLKEAMNLAKKQIPVASSSSESSAPTESSANTETPAAGSGEGTYSQNPSGAAANNTGSRVPIQSVDPNDPAFAWGPGVLDVTISTMQSRGYISGNNYILLPAAIDTNGQGWYNIYKPDGSYLFSINCKTGFWAGTGGKHPNLGATFN